MLRELSFWELGVWAAFYREDPWGEQRADERAAIGHALLANVHRDSRLRPDPFRVRDFMPYVRPTEQELARELGTKIAEAFSARERVGDRERKAWRSRRRKGQS